MFRHAELVSASTKHTYRKDSESSHATQVVRNDFSFKTAFFIFI